MRLYDHYRFRFVTKASATKAKGSMTLTQKPMTLDTTSGWTDSYYDPKTLKFADRMIFSGTMHGGSAAAAHAQPSIQQVRSAAKAPGTAAASAAHVRAPRKTTAKKSLR